MAKGPKRPRKPKKPKKPLTYYSFRNVESPLKGFHFSVDLKSSKTFDSQFQEVSGLTAEMEIEEIVEGGVNNYKHRLPGRVKYNNLVLKRGIILKSSELHDWLEDCLFKENSLERITTKDLQVALLLEKDADQKFAKSKEALVWTINKAYPVKYSMSNFNAQENALAIETIEFAFRNITVDR